MTVLVVITSLTAMTDGSCNGAFLPSSNDQPFRGCTTPNRQDKAVRAILAAIVLFVAFAMIVIAVSAREQGEAELEPRDTEIANIKVRIIIIGPLH